MEKFTDFYAKVIDLGIEHDHHESDLYVPMNAQTKELVNNYEYAMMVSTFKSNFDGTTWYSVFSAYTPWWEARVGKND